MSGVKALLDRRYQARVPQLGARVISRPTDDAGLGLGYVVCEVAGQTGVNVYTGLNDAYYPGDVLLVEQRGAAAAAQYFAVGWSSGLRPSAGQIEITADTVIGNGSYSAGDLIWGNPFEAHFHMDYDTGVINLKLGAALTGQIDAKAGAYIAGDPAKLHGRFTADGIEFRNGATVLSGWDSTGRTIYGVETLGRPHGPCIQQKETVDPGTGETRYVWQILGLNGVPGIAFVTGTVTNPNDYRFYVGPTGTPNRLSYENGNLTLTGQVSATSGAIAGWTIGADSIYKLASGTPAVSPVGGVVISTTAGVDSGPLIKIYDLYGNYTAGIGNFATGSYGLFATTSGQIGSWYFDGQKLFDAGSHVLLDAYNVALSLGGSSYATDGVQMQYNGGNPRAYIGDGANQYFKFDGTNVAWKGTNTELTAAGAFTATSATITGAVTATSGAIGGWTVGATALTAGSGGNTVGLDSGGTNPALYAGSATPGSAPFRVTQAGALTATSATITGTVTATNGAIGGWTVGATALTAGSGGNTVGLDSGGTNPALYAGSATPGSAPFRVTQAGALTATNATITGTVNWGGGKGVLNTTGLDYTYGTGDFVKIDAASAAEGILRVSALGSAFSNGINVSIDSAMWGLAISHTDCRLAGGVYTNIEGGGDGGLGSLGYGYACNMTRKSGSLHGGYLWAYQCNIVSAIPTIGDGEHVPEYANFFYGTVNLSGYGSVAHGLEAEILSSGTNGYAYGIDVTVNAGGTNGTAYGVNVNVSAGGSGGTAYTFHGSGAALVNSHGAVLNEDSYDSDTRIEGNGDANLLFVDAGTDRVGIGDAAPGEKLDVAGNVNVTGAYKVDDVQVVSNRVVDARCDDTINESSWDSTTAGVLDALRDAMITHGLIAAA